MLEDLVRKTKPVLAASLVLLLGTCSTARNEPVTLNKFFTERRIIEEEETSQEKTRKEFYKYGNGIEIDVFYRKRSKSKDLTIKVLKDPNNLLIKDTPKTDSAEGTTYYLFFGETYFRKLNFRFNNKNIEVNFNRNSEITYKQDDKKPENVPFGLSRLIFIKLDDIDKNLFLTEHISYLERF